MNHMIFAASIFIAIVCILVVVIAHARRLWRIEKRLADLENQIEPPKEPQELPPPQ